MHVEPAGLSRLFGKDIVIHTKCGFCREVSPEIRVVRIDGEIVYACPRCYIQEIGVLPTIHPSRVHPEKGSL